MTYHRDVLAKEILLALLAAKPDSLPAVLVEKAFELADLMIERSGK